MEGAAFEAGRPLKGRGDCQCDTPSGLWTVASVRLGAPSGGWRVRPSPPHPAPPRGCLAPLLAPALPALHPRAEQPAVPMEPHSGMDPGRLTHPGSV